jgi:integration host factor subunit alpha
VTKHLENQPVEPSGRLTGQGRVVSICWKVGETMVMGGRAMGGKTLTRADLAEAIVEKVGLPRNESQELVELVLGEISTCLADGKSVKLSSFGSFGIRQKGERVGRNPKTGQEVPITPRRVLVFRASNIMKNRINSGLARKKAAE